MMSLIQQQHATALMKSNWTFEANYLAAEQS